MRRFILFAATLLAALALFLAPSSRYVDASSHREAPLIATDPLADNTDLWVFRAPDDPNTVTIIAGYIGLELPEGGPNWTTFGENIRYEIHIKNKTSSGALGTAKDDITYRFTFQQTNEDPTTFFNIRLGQNLKTTYTCEKSTDGTNFTPIVMNGIVPPNNIGPRSITFAGGAGGNYDALVAPAIVTASSGEKIFCGPRDDPFFVDLGGVFDLGQTRGGSYGTDPNNSNYARDAVAGYNVHCIIMQIPINVLQKDGKMVSQAADILDGDFVIGVWASASRQQMTTLQPTGPGSKPLPNGNWVQVSRLGMPLTNEAVIPIEDKDYWNAVTPYSADEQYFIKYFANLELSLYMQDGGNPANPTAGLGDLVPALAPLRVQTQSYPAIGTIPPSTTPGFDFRYGKDGVFAVTRLNPVPDLSGTAFDPNVANIQPGLVGPGQPRLVDIFPIFYFGVPNVRPYQLATGKTGGPLSVGKPFIHNFLPLTNDGGKLYGGDMLRLNMATPVTPRGTADYRSNAYKGLIQAAVLGLTDPAYAGTSLQPIPHMDGFPNGRRLEDDVTTIELQAVGGLVLAAVGLPFDDATAANYSDLASAKLVAELSYNAGPTANDVPLLPAFPFAANPHRGYDYVKQLTAKAPGTTAVNYNHLNIGVPKSFIVEQNYPNPFNPATEIRYQVSKTDNVKLKIYNSLGQVVTTLVDKQQTPGTYSVVWDATNVASGTYYYRIEVGNEVFPAKKALLVK
jgi:hypothetical protein